MACIDSTFLGGDGFVLRTVVFVSFMQQQYVGKLIGGKYEQNKNEMMMGYMQKKRKKKSTEADSLIFSTGFLVTSKEEREKGLVSMQ